MITIDDKRNCVGCGACLCSCPAKAIEMKEDEEGFLYPVVNEFKCIKCNACEKVCPVLSKKVNTVTPFLKTFALVNNNEKIRAQSSSGGVFFEIAKRFIDQGGSVYGVAFDDKFMTQHRLVTKCDELHLLMGSKYLQSPSFKRFDEIKQKLKNQEVVLFSGTPCQISGLRNFLHKDYNNLYCVEICCHAVPSPKAWRYYLKQFSQHVIGSVSFRSKFFGWNHYGVHITDSFGHDLVKQPKEENEFMRGFLNSLFDRPSCSKCPQKPFKSSADAVIGDFWGINIHHTDKNDNKGASLFIPLTKKGEVLFESVKNEFSYWEIDSSDVWAANGNFSHPEIIHKNRALFWKLTNKKGLPFNMAVKKCLRVSLYARAKRKLRKIFHI